MNHEAGAPPALTSRRWVRRVVLLLSVFGPATITAMADNDAGGVATYSMAGATLGYPILFVLFLITPLLAITQEMGMRLTLVTRRGLADLIREKNGVGVSLLIFSALLLANLGTLTTEFAAIGTVGRMLGIPLAPFIILTLLVALFFITQGSYRLTQTIMLIVSLFYVTYVAAAIQSRPDWGLALSNLIFPHGVSWTAQYLRNYLIVGMGVLGTTITPWGQFFISSFAFDKKINRETLRYSQLETYAGAVITDFFSFFMIVATASTLFSRGIPLTSGEQAAEAIRPFAGDMAGTLFAVGILAAAFMGLVIVPLSTAYAFSEFFGLSGSLDSDYRSSRTFYALFTIQLIVAAILASIPGISLFHLAIVTQSLNAVILPLVFHHLLRLAGDRRLMGSNVNTAFQTRFTAAASVIIVLASVTAVAALVFRL